MTTKDEALKQALEALEFSKSYLNDLSDAYGTSKKAKPGSTTWHVQRAIKACREALAQKDVQEPVAVGEIVQRQARRNVGGSDTGLGYSDGYVTDTWKDVEFYPFYLNDKRRFAPKWNEALEVGTKLYTAPPKRKPLTDEQIREIADSGCYRGMVFVDGTKGIALDKVTVCAFAKAIEQAHGIWSRA